MNILIIEDNLYKSEQIQKFLIEEFSSSQITIKESYNSALKEIKYNYILYDFILLDVSMPTYDIKKGEFGGEPIPLAGKLILEEMYLRDIPTKVIVVTMYENFVDGTKLENLDYQFKEEFENNYLGYVYFSGKDINWKENLKSKIQEIL